MVGGGKGLGARRKWGVEVWIEGFGRMGWRGNESMEKEKGSQRWSVIDMDMVSSLLVWVKPSQDLS